jgi:hypothetical protein
MFLVNRFKIFWPINCAGSEICEAGYAASVERGNLKDYRYRQYIIKIFRGRLKEDNISLPGQQSNSDSWVLRQVAPSMYTLKYPDLCNQYYFINKTMNLDSC